MNPGGQVPGRRSEKYLLVKALRPAETQRQESPLKASLHKTHLKAEIL